MPRMALHETLRVMTRFRRPHQQRPDTRDEVVADPCEIPAGDRYEIDSAVERGDLLAATADRLKLIGHLVVDGDTTVLPNEVDAVDVGELLMSMDYAPPPTEKRLGPLLERLADPPLKRD